MTNPATAAPDGPDDPSGSTPPRIDESVPQAARRYNAFLGGKDNFAADRASAARIEQEFPDVGIGARANRTFMHRAVRLLAEHGIVQFLDVGTGIPLDPNVHQIAQQVNPRARVVYVDNDAVVLAHARALLTSGPDGDVAYLDADLRQPHTILNNPALHRTLDLTQPVAVLLIAVLHFLSDHDDPHGIVAHLIGALPAGSFVAITHATTDFLAPDLAARAVAVSAASGIAMTFRTKTDVGRFFNGLHLLDPGVVPIADWHPDDDPALRPTPERTAMYGAVAHIR